MPDGLTGAAENFEYFLKTEQFMQGRGQWLPWEFLVLVVNHKTPMEEREWALKSYLPKRMMIGKCYAEVPYDQLMLETGSAQAKMNGHVYTLASLSEHGGVCAHQADFASRVGKSLAVPAAYALAIQPVAKWRDVLFFFISTKFLPIVAAILPLWIIARDLGILNTRLVLIILYTAMNLPLAVWMLRSFFSEVPRELIEAAHRSGRSGGSPGPRRPGGGSGGGTRPAASRRPRSRRGG